MSGFPAGVLTRTFTVGGALSLPGGADLVHEVELRASRRLIWAATGTRIYLDPVQSTSAEGAAVSFTEAVTDQDGWLTDRGEAIVLDQPNSYTHTYTVVVRVLKAGVELHKYTSVPFVLPQGVGTLRLEDLINAEAVPGLHISLPEKWDALVAQAVAAAGSATNAGVSAAAAAQSALEAAQSEAAAEGARDEAVALVDGINLDTAIQDYLTANPPTADLTGYVQTTDPRLADARTPTSHTHDDRYYTETETDALLAGKQAVGSYAATSHNHDGTYSPLGHNHTGTYAPALGPDDNYVTDAEKAALHTHPAVIAQGATAATARAAIGAGTSSFSGAYADLSGKPTLGTAAATASTAYATAAQGAKADTALQPTTGQVINAQTGTTYTLMAGDAGKLVTLTNAAAITLTVPGSVFTTGQRVDVLVLGAGMVTAVGSSCTVNGTPSLVSRAQWSAFTVLFTSATTAIMIGDLA